MVALQENRKKEEEGRHDAAVDVGTWSRLGLQAELEPSRQGHAPGPSASASPCTSHPSLLASPAQCRPPAPPARPVTPPASPS